MLQLGGSSLLGRSTTLALILIALQILCGVAQAAFDPDAHPPSERFPSFLVATVTPSDLTFFRKQSAKFPAGEVPATPDETFYAVAPDLTDGGPIKLLTEGKLKEYITHMEQKRNAARAKTAFGNIIKLRSSKLGNGGTAERVFVHGVPNEQLLDRLRWWYAEATVHELPPVRGAQVPGEYIVVYQKPRELSEAREDFASELDPKSILDLTERPKLQLRRQIESAVGNDKPKFPSLSPTTDTSYRTGAPFLFRTNAVKTATRWFEVPIEDSSDRQKYVKLWGFHRNSNKADFYACWVPEEREYILAYGPMSYAGRPRAFNNWDLEWKHGCIPLNFLKFSREKLSNLAGLAHHISASTRIASTQRGGGIAMRHGVGHVIFNEDTINEHGDPGDFQGDIGSEYTGVENGKRYLSNRNPIDLDESGEEEDENGYAIMQNKKTLKDEHMITIVNDLQNHISPRQGHPLNLLDHYKIEGKIEPRYEFDSEPKQKSLQEAKHEHKVEYLDGSYSAAEGGSEGYSECSRGDVYKEEDMYKHEFKQEYGNPNGEVEDTLFDEEPVNQEKKEHTPRDGSQYSWKTKVETKFEDHPGIKMEPLPEFGTKAEYHGSFWEEVPGSETYKMEDGDLVHKTLKGEHEMGQLNDFGNYHATDRKTEDGLTMKQEKLEEDGILLKKLEDEWEPKREKPEERTPLRRGQVRSDEEGSGTIDLSNFGGSRWGEHSALVQPYPGTPVFEKAHTTDSVQMGSDTRGSDQGRDVLSVLNLVDNTADVFTELASELGGKQGAILEDFVREQLTLLRSNLFLSYAPDGWNDHGESPERPE